jgi:hypothetical protein
MKLILIFSLVLGQVPSARRPVRRWRPATYRGLTVGKSNRADVLRVLGQPKWSRAHEGEDDAESGQKVWNNYERAGEFPGTTTVVIDGRSGVIARIDFYPERLTKEQAVAHFGPGYIVTKYDFDPCPGDEESEPIYESPDGPLVSVEYRSRGIAISVGYKDLVTKISYVGGPIGATKSKCKGGTAGRHALRRKAKYGVKGGNIILCLRPLTTFGQDPRRSQHLSNKC